MSGKVTNLKNTTNLLTLYHASRCSFERFDPAYYQTGEGVGNYEGWYFCSTPREALRHCESYLRCNAAKNQGFILECQIESKYVDNDIDGTFTEPCYDGRVSGVSLFNSSKIKIIRIISPHDVFESVYGTKSKPKHNF